MAASCHISGGNRVVPTQEYIIGQKAKITEYTSGRPKFYLCTQD